MTKIWHPLKIAAVLYIIADVGLLLGGLGYDNWLLAASGVLGMLGNLSLLIGGSGEKHIASKWLRHVAPYAERLSMGLYFMQGIAFAASCAWLYDSVIWSGIVGVAISSCGNLVGIFMKAGRRGLQPYQVTGTLFLIASLLGLTAGIESNNLGVIIAHVALVFGAICMMLSHRAEFKAA